MAEMIDGKPVKLRTACDACSESKVRCSQAKPTCGRCEKNGITCVYGLSRRSHKLAARVGTSISSLSHRTTPQSSSSSIIDNPDIAHESPSPSRTYSSTESNQSILRNLEAFFRARGNVIDTPPSSSSSHVSSSASYAQNLDFGSVAGVSSSLSDATLDNFFLGSLESDFNFTTQHQPERIDPKHQQFLLSGSPEGFDLSLPIAAVTIDQSNHPASAAKSDPEPVMTSTTPSGSCGCTARLMASLATLQSPCPEDQPSFDVQLSRLKDATKLSESCMTCNCYVGDEIVTVLNSILIFRIIQGFESALSLAATSGEQRPLPPEKSSSSHRRQSSCDASPPLSWGAMQLDHDEMEDLKQHIWLLQFRKLEKLLESLRNAIRRMRADGTVGSGGSSEGGRGDDELHAYTFIAGGKGAKGGNSALVMACECIHMWLNQKARILREHRLS
ncbi:hypothetical protein F5Y14DRAFT_433819 [Nemania sp. NC0429]|nr:hypothetical protein F5Y14DRAFT_433819 [Nemania sp. NC0429]